MPGFPPNTYPLGVRSYHTNTSVFTSVTGTRQHRVNVIIIIIVVSAVVAIVVVVVRRNVISFVSVCESHWFDHTIHIHIATHRFWARAIFICYFSQFFQRLPNERNFNFEDRIFSVQLCWRRSFSFVFKVFFFLFIWFWTRSADNRMENSTKTEGKSNYSNDFRKKI